MEIVQYLTTFGIAITVMLVALVSVAIGLSLLHASRKDLSVFFTPILLLLALGGLLDVALSGRTLQTDVGAAGADSGALEVASKMPVKLLLGVLTGLAIVALANKFVQAHREINFPVSLTASFMGFYLFSNPIPAAFGFVPSFSYSLLYVPIILGGLFATIPSSPQIALRACKWVMLLIVIPSLFAAAIVPTLAIQTTYKGVIPGFDLRLWGLTSHANVLGPTALTLCLIEWTIPTRNKWLHRLILLSGVIALLLTQSKTSIFSGLLAILVVITYRSFTAMKNLEKAKRAISVGINYTAIISLAVVLIVILALMVALLFGDIIGLEAMISRRLATIDFSTASGRTAIWTQAIKEGMKAPLFGYGLEIWGPEYRMTHRLESAFHAHNQFLQVFSVAGFLGLIAFTIYFLVLCKISFQVASVSRGVSLAFLTILVVRSFSEVPIQFGGFTGGDFLSHFVFVIFVGTLRGRTLQPREPVIQPRGTLGSIRLKANYGNP